MMKTAIVLMFCLSLFLNLLLATSLYESIQDYSRDNIIRLANRNTEISWVGYFMNVRNYTYCIEKNILIMSLIPGNNTEIPGFYIVKTEFNLPLQQSLNLTFSMWANLSVNSDGAFMVVSASDGREVIEVSYYIGQGLSEYVKENYYHVSYQIGNLSNVWFKPVRNIWSDLTAKSSLTNRQWKIIGIKLGIFSHPTSPSEDRRVEANLNLTDSIFQGEASYVTVNSSSIHLSLKPLACMVAVTLIFALLCLVYIAVEKKLK